MYTYMDVLSEINLIIIIITDYKCLPIVVLFPDVAEKAGIRFPQCKGKCNFWVIAISGSEAERGGTLRKPTLITAKGGGTTCPEYSDQVQIRGINYINIMF